METKREQLSKEIAAANASGDVYAMLVVECAAIKAWEAKELTDAEFQGLMDTLNLD